jgi:hypothetical protein
MKKKIKRAMKNLLLFCFVTLMFSACEETKKIRELFAQDIILDSLANICQRISIDDSNIVMASSEVSALPFYSYNINKHEGCTDYLVYPGGYSGPTISCGLDLGNIGENNAEEVLKGKVSENDFKTLMKATSIRGSASQEFIRKHQVKISQHSAILICNGLKFYVWRLATHAYPNAKNAPTVVQEAILTACIASGVGSSRLSEMSSEISAGNWLGVGQAISRCHADLVGGPYERIWKNDQELSENIRLTLTHASGPIDYD